MSEELNQVEEEQLDLPVEEQEVEQVNPEVEKASKNGWRPKEDFVESGRDADDWVSAKKFNERGDMIGTIREMKAKQLRQEERFDSELKNINALHEAAHKKNMGELEAQQRQAVELADTESFDRVHAQIKEMEKTAPVAPAPQVNNDEALINTFNSENPWIMEDTPKAAYAKAKFTTFGQQGMTAEQAIQATMNVVTQQFPEINQARNKVQAMESPRGAPVSKPTKNLSWGDLTTAEVNFYNQFGSRAWKTKELFLEDAKKIRDEAKS